MSMTGKGKHHHLPHHQQHHPQPHAHQQQHSHQQAHHQHQQHQQQQQQQQQQIHQHQQQQHINQSGVTNAPQAYNVAAANAGRYISHAGKFINPFYSSTANFILLLRSKSLR